MFVCSRWRDGLTALHGTEERDVVTVVEDGISFAKVSVEANGDLASDGLVVGEPDGGEQFLDGGAVLEGDGDSPFVVFGAEAPQIGEKGDGDVHVEDSRGQVRGWRDLGVWGAPREGRVR